jgi:hypothetical protein
LALAGVVMVACAQIINADFDNLKPRRTSTAGSAGSGEGGTAGMGGDMGSGGDATDASGGSSAGGSSGNGGLGGSSPEASAGAGGTRDSGPDVVADADSGRPDVEPDRSTPTDGPKDQIAVDVPDVVEVDADASILTGAVLNEINAQGALEDFIEITNLDSVPYDLSQHSVTQGMGMFGLPDTPAALTFADGTMLGPHERLLIVANQAPPRMKGGPNTPCNVAGFDGPPYNVTSCYYVDWGVSKSGERVYFLGPGGVVREYADFPAATMSPPPSGKSYGRFPDGTGPWQNAGTAWTPQAENHL